MTKSRFDVERPADEIFYESELLSLQEAGTELLSDSESAPGSLRRDLRIKKKIKLPAEALFPFIGRKLAEIEMKIDDEKLADAFSKADPGFMLISEDTGDKIRLKNGSLGRDPAKVSMPVPRSETFKNISRVHLEISILGDTVLLKDTSSNGTFLMLENGEKRRMPKERFVEIKKGDRLSLANAVFRVEAS